MVQGAPKKSLSGSKPARSNNKRTALGPRPGAKVIKPKKALHVARSKLLKKHSAGLTAVTEKNLAERAGHLELLKGGKKDRAADKGKPGKGVKKN